MVLEKDNDNSIQFDINTYLRSNEAKSIWKIVKGRRIKWMEHVMKNNLRIITMIIEGKIMENARRDRLRIKFIKQS